MSRKTISISLDETLIEWLDQVVEEDYRYYNRSQLIEIVLQEYKQKRESST